MEQEQETGVKTLVIKPIVKAKFSGVSSYSKTQTVFCGAELDLNGLYKTGLDREKEKHYEHVLNLAPGTLGKKSTFWGDLEIRINNDKPTRFPLSGYMDELKEYVIRAHSKIANSELHLMANPQAMFFIDDPEEKAKLESQKMDYELEAIDSFTTLPIEDKRSMLRLYGKSGIDNMSETMIKAELYKEVKKDPVYFVKTLQNPKLMKAHALLKELVEKRVVTKKGAYYYNNEDMIGASTDEAISYLNNIKNQQIKLALENKVKNLRKDK